MATKSRIAESAFRLGVGRYIQEERAIARLGEEIVRLGKCRPFILGSKTALKLTKSLIESSLGEKHICGVFYKMAGLVNLLCAVFAVFDCIFQLFVYGRRVSVFEPVAGFCAK